MRRLERDELFHTLPGFDDPLEMLLGCHRRIERQLETLRKLRAHVAAKGVDADASLAAQTVLRYFAKAAGSHHEDEEQDVFPLLEQRITDPGEKLRFVQLRATLEEDHRKLNAAWARLKRPLEGIAEGFTRALPDVEVGAFTQAYAHHILAEEHALTEFFNRWLGDADREALGRSMAARRTRPLA